MNMLGKTPISRRHIAEWWTLGLGLLLVILAGAMTVRMVRLNAEQNASVAHTLEVLAAGAALHIAVTEANSAQRGYLLTGHPVFRQRYERARADIWPNVDRLGRMTLDNSAQQARVQKMRQVLAARQAEWDTVGRMADTGDVKGGAGRQLVGLELTEDFRNILQQMTDDENALLAQRRASADASGDWVLIIGVGGLGMAAMLVGLSITTLRRRAAELETANAEVRRLMGGLEDRVAERTQDLAEANEEIQRFAYIVSHDLRSPLVNIMGFSAELEEVQGQAAQLVERLEREAPGLLADSEREALSAELPEALAFIRASTARMDRLIKAILSISRTGRRTLAAERVDLSALLGGLAVTQQAQLSETEAQLTVGPMPEIESDRFALEQIFANLIDNAVKYRRDSVPLTIDITAEDLGSKVRVSVADNGRGIAPADQERVFEPFRRAGVQDRQGEGIGLAHVRALARRLGGSISLESMSGEGSRFLVTLPKKLPQTWVAEE
ncbi:sensor histidine kinase [Sandaracinobacteroides hominis]|uniref:sensor histidine kinase n=1 Tax=Sandaracinobacteroides hominis TaxID=2780086 RepID=UPI0018F322CA|nr:ATP-binding protein [Sandaracinobacteroides hominis]